MNHAEYKFPNADRLESEFLANTERHKQTRMGLFEAAESDLRALVGIIQSPGAAEAFRAVLEGTGELIADLQGEIHDYRASRAKLASAFCAATGEAPPEDPATEKYNAAKREYIETIDAIDSLFSVLQVYGDAELESRDPESMFGIGKAGVIVAARVRDSVDTLID